MTELISYDQFGTLKFLDFFPRAALYDNDDIGGTVTIIGHACVDGYGFTGFARLPSQTETGAINLDFSHDCPEAEGNALLARIGLKFGTGASLSQVSSQLGTPEKDQTNPIGFRFCSFIVGERWPYNVTCAFDQEGKLYQVGVARKDLVDNNKETP
jgi:hypothetical protein